MDDPLQEIQELHENENEDFISNKGPEEKEDKFLDDSFGINLEFSRLI